MPNCIINWKIPFINSTIKSIFRRLHFQLLYFCSRNHEDESRYTTLYTRYSTYLLALEVATKILTKVPASFITISLLIVELSW